MRRLAIALGMLAAGVLLAIVLVAIRVDAMLDAPVDVADAGLDFEIAPGSSFSAISSRLEDAGVIGSARLASLHARVTGTAASIKAGEYRIEPGITVRELFDRFRRGDVRLYAFTIVEGWNHRELLAALARQPAVVVQMGDDDWAGLLAELGAEQVHPEGLFLPETYHFPRGTSDRDILGDAFRLQQKALAEEWATRAEDAVVTTPYEALILASIIEKETARADERERISGVFSRRLQKRMRLQTDPTVIYGIGPDFDGNLTRRDMQTDTPYNTYTRGGLPPTPIAMPGRAAIRAALHPADGDELYFVATGLPDGSHRFSATKAEHDAAVAEYLQRLRGRGGQ